MTKKEYYTFYNMNFTEFKKLQNPTAEQCLIFLRGYTNSRDRINMVHVIPSKHKEFCKTQLKLESLL